MRLARFCRAKIRAGCCPGFRGSGWIFRVFLESSCIRCLSLSTFFECCISIYFFEINDVINDVSSIWTGTEHNISYAYLSHVKPMECQPNDP